MDKISPPQSQGDVTPPGSQEVIDRLENFYIIQNPKVRTIFGWIPLLLILLVIADWLLGVGTFSRDTFRMTTVLMVALALIAIQILFDQ